MNQLEAYSLLFVDSFVANLVIGFRDELIFFTMKMFGTYNNLIMFLVSTSAATIANIVNYLFGIVLLNIFYYLPKEKEEIIRNKKITKLYLKYDIILLFFIFLPFWGTLVALIAGFFKTNFLRFLAISTIIKACYYFITIIF